MHLKEYFKTTNGVGVLSTADRDGKVNAAIYAKPHVMADGTVAFIMRDRLSHHNLTGNPHAAYLFIENVVGYRGVRLYLKKKHEDTDADLIRQLTRRSLSPEEDVAKGPKFLVYFEVEKALNLIGSDASDVELD